MIKIIGIKKVDFVTKEGQSIEGYTIHWTEKPNEGQEVDVNLQGVTCDHKFINKSVYDAMCQHAKSATILNMSFNDFLYNKYGKITGFDNLIKE